MASLRAFRPLAQQAARLTFRPTTTGHVTRRALNTETAPIMFSQHASVTGGREGHAVAENLDVQLAMPKSMGGTGNGTTPEELFAAGYGACFQGSMVVSAPAVGVTLPKKTEDLVVEATVHMVGDAKKLDMGIRVEMKVKAKGMSKEDLDKLVEKTKEVCPYSRATKGNVFTTVTTEVS